MMAELLRRPVAWVLGALLLAAACYAPGLSGPLLLDDLPNLAPFFAWVHGSGSWLDVVNGNHAGPLGRPVSMLSFVASGWLSGASTYGLKAFNVAVHLVNGALVFGLMRDLLRHDALLAPARERIAAAIAIVWVLHPVHVSTVLYVIQRMAELSATFMIAAVWLFVRARTALAAGARGPRTIAKLAGVALLTGVAVLAKENGAVVPLLCLAIEVGYFRAADRPRVVHAFFATCVVLPAVLAVAVLATHPGVVLRGYELRDFTLVERLWSQARALWAYVGAFLLPDGRSIGVFGDDFPISHDWCHPRSTFAALAAWPVAIGLAAALRTRAPAILVGVLWYLGAHAVESTILPLELYFEHRDYLPSIGILLALTGGLALLFERVRRDPRARPAALARVAMLTLAAVLAFATHARALAWRDHATLAERMLSAHPGSLRARTEYATVALARRDFAGAARIIDGLVAGADPDERLLGHIYRASIACRFQHGGDASDPARLVALARPRLNARDVEAFELLATQVGSGYCPSVDAGALANAYVALADASAQPERLYPKWRLRQFAAALYLQEGDRARARAQLEIAWNSGGAAPTVGARLARIRLDDGDADGAGALAADVRRARGVDADTRAELDAIERELEARRARQGSSE